MTLLFVMHVVDKLTHLDKCVRVCVCFAREYVRIHVFARTMFSFFLKFIMPHLFYCYVWEQYILTLTFSPSDL